MTQFHTHVNVQDVKSEKFITHSFIHIIFVWNIKTFILIFMVFHVLCDFFFFQHIRNRRQYFFLAHPHHDEKHHSKKMKNVLPRQNVAAAEDILIIYSHHEGNV